MSRKKKPIHTDIGWSNPASVTVFGKDLPGEIMGNLNLGDMGFLELTRRLPNPNESRMFNAMVVTLVEHGITPSALAARLTYLGAPDSLQGAVAAGLLGLGTVFVGSIEGCAKMLYEVMPEPNASADFKALAHAAVEPFFAAKRIVPGLGHPVHKPLDPRATRLFQIAKETRFDGPYLRLVQAVAAEAESRSGKSLPVNATGAIGALCCEMRFDWKICRGLGVMARAVGLVGHLLEESRTPMAEEIWHTVDEQATRHMRDAAGGD